MLHEDWLFKLLQASEQMCHWFKVSVFCNINIKISSRNAVIFIFLDGGKVGFDSFTGGEILRKDVFDIPGKRYPQP